MSKLEQFLKELKLTPKQAKKSKRSKNQDVKKSSREKTRQEAEEKKQKKIQEERRKKRIQMKEEIEEASKIIVSQEIQAENKAENDAAKAEEKQTKDQTNMDVGDIETDLGCNIVDDHDEDDENQHNEICKITLNKREDPYFTEQDLIEAKQGIFTNQTLVRGRDSIGLQALDWRINDVLNDYAQLRNILRDTRLYKIEEIIYDVIVRLVSNTSKVNVENKTGKFKGENNSYFSCIYKSNGLIDEILTTLSRYKTLTLTESDILVILLYGVTKPTKTNSKKYKVELPKPKLRIISGESNTEKFEKVLKCKQTLNGNGCGLYSELTSLYQMLNNDNDLIKSIILWFDTHHDFKVARYDKAKNVWDNFGGVSFINWYVNKFFTLDPSNNNNINQYLFSNEAINTILEPVVSFSNRLSINGNPNPTVIPTLLYKISQEYLQNNDFEKKMLLHYIVHNFNVPTDNSTTLLRDILYVNKDTYHKLRNNIEKIIQDNNNEKIIKGAKVKLEKLKEFFEDSNGTQTFGFTEPNDLPFFNTNYVKDAGTSSYPLSDDKVQYVPAALFDANKSNTYEPQDFNNTEYDTFIDTKIKENNKPYDKVENKRLKTVYKYGGCKLEITPPKINGFIKNSDIRCSIKSVIPDDEKIDKKTYSYLIKYLNYKGIYDPIFIEKMYDVLLRFISKEGIKNVFAIDKNLKLTLPEYFNSIKTGPSVQDLVFLTILYRLNSINTNNNPTGDISLQLIDNIVNLKRLGDYGQVMDAKIANLPFFTIDSMESLMCIIEKVSCYIDFNQGVIIYDNGKINGTECIRSKALNPPGYGRRT